jgi:hypothetical protein
MDPILILIVLAALAIYFVPSMVSEGRRHPQRNAILLLNLFLGWTFVGWVAALVWSATAIDDEGPATD